ncbi:hypothetical protein ACHQM5_024423 [Ranunculus cassubicifolius]
MEALIAQIERVEIYEQNTEKEKQAAETINNGEETSRLAFGTADGTEPDPVFIQTEVEFNQTANQQGEVSRSEDGAWRRQTIREGATLTHPIVVLAEKKSTWAEKLGKNGVGQRKIRYIPPSLNNGRSVVHIKSSQFERLKPHYENLVIGSFVGTRKEYNFVKKIVTTTWKPKKGFVMKTYGKQSFSFEFESDEDKQVAIDMGNFHIASQVFLVRQWEPFVEADINNLKTIPIWILLKNYPMEMWDDEGFSSVASAVGEPLFVDKLTEEKKRTEYARVCVEVHVDDKYPDVIPIIIDNKKAISINVEYNWRPPKCSKCRVFGHWNCNCGNFYQVYMQV